MKEFEGFVIAILVCCCAIIVYQALNYDGLERRTFEAWERLVSCNCGKIENK